MVVSPKKDPSVDLSSSGDTPEAANQNDEVIEIRGTARKRARDDFTSMEPDGLSAHSVQQHRVIPCAGSGVFTPSASLARHSHSVSSHHHTKVPQSVTITDSKASSTDWSPLPFQESMHASSTSKSLQHAYQAMDNSRIVASAFSEMGYLQTSSSLIFDYASLLVPPSLISRASSQCYLLGQPMIQSPAPVTFLTANRPPGSTVRRYLSSMTPLSENTFHPTMFSADATTSDRTPYSDDGGAVFRSSSRDDYATKVALFAQQSESIALERTRSVSFAADKFRKTDVLPADPVNANASILSAHSVNTPPPRTRPIPRVYASKMLIYAATKRAPGEDDDSGDDLEKLFCTCPKSRCLKLYCVCFQRAVLCDAVSCMCSNCKNTMKHAGPNGARTMAMANIEKRRPGAFGKREKQVGLGCSCKRNKCLKKYCACYSEGTPCDDKCGCVNCHNVARPSAWFSGSPLSMGSEICPV